MNVDSILLSEHASTDATGRLTVVNAFNSISGPGPVWAVPVLAISIVIHGHSAEAGSEHEGEIRLIDAERTAVKPPMKFEFAFTASTVSGIPVRFIQTLSILGATFESPGPYAFEVYIDGTYHAAASLFVQKQP